MTEGNDGGGEEEEEEAGCTGTARLGLVDEGGGENERGNGKRLFTLRALCAKNRKHLSKMRCISSVCSNIIVLAPRGRSVSCMTSRLTVK